MCRMIRVHLLSFHQCPLPPLITAARRYALKALMPLRSFELRDVHSVVQEQPPSDSGLSPPADDGDNERRGQLMKVTLTVGILGLKSSELALKPSQLVSPEAARLQPLNMSDPEAQQYLLELCDTVAETYDLKSCVWRDIVGTSPKLLLLAFL